MSASASTIDLNSQIRLAEMFAELHRQDRPLVLPNAWDAGSARLIQDSGASAIATTSGGVAWSVGVADGGGPSRDRATTVIRDIVKVVDVPVTADIETGYGVTLDELRITVTSVLEAGAVGINIEDSGGDPLYTAEEQAERIASVREAADAFGVPLFINARTDVYLFGVGKESGRLDDVTSRAKTYAAAGANGIFVPGLLDLDALTTLASTVDMPVNTMVGPGAPSVDQLVEAGVRRVSAGTGLTQMVYAHTQCAAREMLEHGTYGALAETIEFISLQQAFTT